MDNTETIFIDGGTGEGGGQILRTSLALACITGKNLHIENIRAARRNPGLAKQHLSCVLAAREICNGKCQGVAPGSRVLDFQPGTIQSGNFHFDIGSAGSASLVIQTVLPALFLADNPSTVTVTGGTYNPLAPPFDFLAETFFPAIATGGFQARCSLIRPGFFPAGGGRITVDIQPRQENTQHIIELCKPVKKPQIHARIYSAKLPPHIARRQHKLLLQSGLDIQDIEQIEVTDSAGPGNCVIIRLCSSDRTTVFTAFGMRGKPSQEVINEVVTLTRNFLTSGAAVDRFLADQLLIYMAMGCHFAKDRKTDSPSKAGCFTTNELSSHLQTNIEIIKKFLPVHFKVKQKKQIYRIACQAG